MTPEKRQDVERFVELQAAAIAAKSWVSLEVPDGFTVAGFESASRTVPVAELLSENQRLRESWDRLAKMYVALGGELDAIKGEP